MRRVPPRVSRGPRPTVALAVVSACLGLAGALLPTRADASEAAVQVVVDPAGDPRRTLEAVRRVGGEVQTGDGRRLQVLLPDTAAARSLDADPTVADVSRPAVATGDAVVSEGVRRIGADAFARQGRDGAGLRIAVLDLAFGSEAVLDALSGVELPPLERQTRRSFDATWGLPGRDFNGHTTNHGERVAELTYDFAPGATYAFVNYHTHLEFGQAVDWLVDEWDADLVVHSNSFLVGPYDGTGWFARRVDEAAAAGVLWVNSVGNYRERHWEGPYEDANRDGALDVPGVGDAFPLPLLATDRPACTLSWPGARPDRDGAYRLGLYHDAAGTSPVLDARTGLPLVSQVEREPAVRAELQPGRLPAAGTFHLRVERVGTPSSGPLTLFCRHRLGAGGTTASSVPTPGDARGALAVGSFHRLSWVVQPYSSEGPTDDGRVKPDVTAPSHGVVSAGATFGGTSGAAPHLAGAAALLWPDLVAEPGAEPVAARVAGRLRAWARDVDAPGPDGRTGYGFARLDLAPPTVDPTVATGFVLPPSGVHVLRVPLLEAGTLEQVALAVDGAAVRSRLEGTTAVASVDSAALASGPHRLTVSAADWAGNASTADVPVLVEPAPAPPAAPPQAAASTPTVRDRTAPTVIVRAPARVLSGARFVVRVVARDDRASGTRVPTVDLGDGRRARGRVVRHRYDRRGLRRLRVTVRDAAGNAAVRRRTVRVDDVAVGRARRGRPELRVAVGRPTRVEVRFRRGGRIVRLRLRLAVGSHRIALGRLPAGRHRVLVAARGQVVAASVGVARR